MRKLRVNSLAAAGLVGLVMAFAAGVVYAGNDNDYRAGWNSQVSFDQVNLTDIFHNAFHSTNATDVAPTDINTTLTHNAFSGEVSVMDASYQSPAYGWYECHAGQWFAEWGN